MSVQDEMAPKLHVHTVDRCCEACAGDSAPALLFSFPRIFLFGIRICYLSVLNQLMCLSVPGCCSRAVARARNNTQLPWNLSTDSEFARGVHVSSCAPFSVRYWRRNQCDQPGAHSSGVFRNNNKSSVALRAPFSTYSAATSCALSPSV